MNKTSNYLLTEPPNYPDVSSRFGVHETKVKEKKRYLGSFILDRPYLIGPPADSDQLRRRLRNTATRHAQLPSLLKMVTRAYYYYISTYT